MRGLCAADKKEKKKGKAHRKYLLTRDALVEPFLKYGCRTAAYGSRKGMMIRRPGDDGRRMSAWRSPKKRSNAPHKQRHESSSKMSAGLRVGAVTLRAREEALPAHPCSCSRGVGKSVHGFINRSSSPKPRGTPTEAPQATMRVALKKQRQKRALAESSSSFYAVEYPVLRCARRVVTSFFLFR